MARIAVVFGTTDGQTAKIVRHVADLLRSERHLVQILDTRASLPRSPLGNVDGVVLAASIRMGKFQRPLLAFVREHREALARIPTVFLAVSLSAARETPPARREVQKTIARFVAETKFTPGEILPVAGALAYSRYGFFTKLAILFISKISGGDTDTSRDYEYTDFGAVSEFVRSFAVRLRHEPAPALPGPHPLHQEIHMKTVGEMMTAHPRCIHASAPIGDAHRLMKEEKLRHLPVLEGGLLVGMVSERDLLRLEATVDVDRKRDPVSAAMSAPAFWVLPETPLPAVASQMRARGVGSAVVLSEGRVIGIFTTSDALDALAAPETFRRRAFSVSPVARREA